MAGIPSRIDDTSSIASDASVYGGSNHPRVQLLRQKRASCNFFKREYIATAVELIQTETDDEFENILPELDAHRSCLHKAVHEYVAMAKTIAAIPELAASSILKGTNSALASIRKLWRLSRYHQPTEYTPNSHLPTRDEVYADSVSPTMLRHVAEPAPLDPVIAEEEIDFEESRRQLYNFLVAMQKSKKVPANNPLGASVVPSDGAYIGLEGPPVDSQYNVIATDEAIETYENGDTAEEETRLKIPRRETLTSSSRRICKNDIMITSTMADNDNQLPMGPSPLPPHGLAPLRPDDVASVASDSSVHGGAQDPVTTTLRGLRIALNRARDRYVACLKEGDEMDDQELDDNKPDIDAARQRLWGAAWRFVNQTKTHADAETASDQDKATSLLTSAQSAMVKIRELWIKTQYFDKNTFASYMFLPTYKVIFNASSAGDSCCASLNGGDKQVLSSHKSEECLQQRTQSSQRHLNVTHATTAVETFLESSLDEHSQRTFVTHHSVQADQGNKVGVQAGPQRNYRSAHADTHQRHHSSVPLTQRRQRGSAGSRIGLAHSTSQTDCPRLSVNQQLEYDAVIRARELGMKEMETSRPKTPISVLDSADYIILRHKFVEATNNRCLSPKDKLRELQRWFAKPASYLVDAAIMGMTTANAQQRLDECMENLDKLFNSRSDTLQTTFDAITNKGALQHDDYMGHKALCCSLIRAKAVARVCDLLHECDEPATIRSIIDARVPHLADEFWSRNARNRNGPPTFDYLIEEIDFWATWNLMKGPDPVSFEENRQFFPEGNCNICDGFHHSHHCHVLEAMNDVGQRVKKLMERSLCFHCFKPGHSARLCTEKPTCARPQCARRHATLLHDRSLARGSRSADNLVT